MHCPKRLSCFDKTGIRRRVLASSCYPVFYRGHQRMGNPEYLSMMRLRKIWAEGSFAVLKREHCISKIRKRGILAATEECLLAAMALNLKRMVNAIFFYLQVHKSGREHHLHGVLAPPCRRRAPLFREQFQREGSASRGGRQSQRSVIVVGDGDAVGSQNSLQHLSAFEVKA